MKNITVSVGDKELIFNVDVSDYNQLINEQMPNDKVAPIYNFLSRTVDNNCKKDFRDAVLVDGQPNGIVLMQIGGIVTEEMADNIQVVVKKPKAMQAS